MKKMLAIYDSDVFYATRFMEYFKNKNDFEFELSAFTVQESLLSYLSQHRVEILLLGTSVSLEGVAGENVGYTYLLREENYSSKDKEQRFIYKYQSAQSVMDELRTDYNRRVAVTAFEGNRSVMEIITIFSPKIGMEEHSYAWSVAFLLAKRKKTLFIPLDCIPAHFLSFIEPSMQKLSEFIYYLKENPNIIARMNSLLDYQGNLCYLAGTAHGFDLLSLTKEDIRKWVSELRLHTDYQSVVFYLNYYDTAGVELMALSDRIHLPMNQSVYYSRILNEWEEQMERLGIEVRTDRYQRIDLMQETKVTQCYKNLQELSESAAWQVAAQNLNCS